MAGYRVRVAVALAIVFATARAHIASHDNILRIQLWDAEGLSKSPEPTEVQKRTHKSRVNLDSLYHAMMDEVYGSDPGRFTRHRVRHKRRRSRRSGEGERWKFHQGRSVNVEEYDDVSAVSSGASAGERIVGPPMTLRQHPPAVEKQTKEEKQLPVVSKCCPSGQNLSWTPVNGSRVCMRTSLTFQPLFFQANDSYMSSYDDNLFEIIVDNPCYYDRYKLDPNVDLNDEFYLLVNGSLFVPYQSSPLLGPKDFCMETFYNATYPAGLTLPLVCFPKPPDDNKTSVMLTLYATGLIISVPFLLATAAVYTFIRELRDTHGKSLACHTICLAVAFSCLAATQLAGDEFPLTACTIMAYLIQYSFVSCFFWLNVMCFDTLLNVKRHLDAKQPRREMRRRFAWYCVYAVVLPLLLLIFTMIMDLSPAVPNSYLKPNFGIKGCWFKTDKAALPYFYIPVALILSSNVIMFFITARAFGKHFDKLKGVNAYELTHSSFSTADDWAQLSLALGEQIPMERSLSPLIDRKKRLKKYKKIFRMCCLLSVIMGMSWVFEVVSWAAGAGSTAFSVWSVFDFLNALQGLVIFAIFVMQQPVRSRVKFSKLCQMCRRRNSGSEVAVVSDRTSIEMGDGKRDAV